MRKLFLGGLLAFVLGLAFVVVEEAPAQAQGIGNPVSVGPYTYLHIAGAATTLVKTGAGVLHYVCDNTPVAAATIKVDDAITDTTPRIAIITVPAAAANPFCQRYDVIFSTGLTIVTSGADDVTIAYR